MSKKMLIVDDDELIRNSITKFCGECNFTPDPVSTGAEALEKIKSNSYDAVIIDYTLGNDMNGEEVLQKLIDSGGKYGKAILMSGTPNMDYKSKKFDFFLEKPIKKSTFKELVDKL